MFVQVIQGKVSDEAKLRAAIEKWEADLADGAEGWLGSTAGVTEDGRSIALVRFESEEAAQRNSDRPEQGEWWAEASQAFDGEVTFQNSEWVDVDTPGDPSQAGFVQVMQGQGTDPDRAREIMSQDSDKWAEHRPDVLGSIIAGHEGGAYTMAIYFTSEEAAREGEKKEIPPELAKQMDEVNSLSVGEPTFYDLKDPWLRSPS
jgi:hypothetical protein